MSKRLTIETIERQYPGFCVFNVVDSRCVPGETIDEKAKIVAWTAEIMRGKPYDLPIIEYTIFMPKRDTAVFYLLTKKENMDLSVLVCTPSVIDDFWKDFDFD